MSPGELATKVESLGIARSAVYYYVNGERVPSKEVVAKLATVLGGAVPEYTMRKVGRPKKIHKTRTQLLNSVIGDINATKRETKKAEDR